MLKIDGNFVIELKEREIKMKTNQIIHTADSRGFANHGWLITHHTFSFAGYNNPERVHFGVLRVLNDDYIAGGMGFGTHPHDNMEIISIPLSGDLAHKDSLGSEGIIKNGEIQVMSAGTGVTHSEYNANKDEAVTLLQIWLSPDKRNVTPRYDQLKYDLKPNEFTQVVSPNADDEGLWIHQNAWFHLADFTAGNERSYELKDPSNGIYLFIISGDLTVNGNELHARDAIGIWDEKSIDIKATSDARFLIMEVPMELTY